MQIPEYTQKGSRKGAVRDTKQDKGGERGVMRARQQFKVLRARVIALRHHHAEVGDCFPTLRLEPGQKSGRATLRLSKKKWSEQQDKLRPGAQILDINTDDRGKHPELCLTPTSHTRHSFPTPVHLYFRQPWAHKETIQHLTLAEESPQMKHANCRILKNTLPLMYFS
ncbi:hypothetical protein DL89DRAFT_301048 [Linderina pennispora]|uniref:Uncharacterized protein n=1 Tax=Linderina pennispora TaxID=61395 RepID=A0A1Y1WNL6_9FUNG|nr:uncharacterized protein DL89DRAFT_301048 [Linderina pennispora]ORX74704.1 hypothetical protein DL89DRAFT_301048 [Linderina pennispora]